MCFSFNRLRVVIIAALLTGGAGCGDINIRDGATAGYSVCEDFQLRFHFSALIPPWKHNKEYRCNAWSGTSCTGGWTPTGRFIFVVADAPFVNYDSEIITSLEVEDLAGDPCLLAQDLIAAESIGQPGSVSQFDDERDYPVDINFADTDGMSGCEVLWRQEREFESATFNWFRRDVYFRRAGGGTFHLKLFSIDTLNKPEFELLLKSFREGPAPSTSVTEQCKCVDEHDPGGPDDC